MRIDPASHMQPAGTVLPPNDTCELLARRLRADTQGEVLFDDGSRGRYATDASIYQITPGGRLRADQRARHRHRHRHRRDLKVPVLARGGGTSQCGQTTGAALVIDNSKHFRRCSR
jgi:FAD/FMN-containing dehydrogenase